MHVQEKEMSNIYMAIMVQAIQMKWCLPASFDVALVIHTLSQYKCIGLKKKSSKIANHN